MTAANTAQPAATPRPAAGGPPRGGRQQAPTIDPVRILRQHAWLLVGTSVAGLVLGTVANFVLLFAYPLWGGNVVFEIRPEVTGAKDAVTREIVQDEAIARLGQTESAKMISKSVLEAAMKAPDVGTTKWGQYYSSVDERVKQLEDTLRVGHRRGTQLFSVTWRTWEKSDVPVILNRVADTYMAARESEENERAARSKGSFEQKKGQIEEEIRTLKTEIQDFIRSKGITAGRESDLADQRSTENLAKLRDDTIRDLTLAQARLDSIDRKINDQRYEDEDRRRALDDMSMRQLEQSLQQIQIALNSTRERFGEEHPQVKDLMQREAAGRARMKSAMDEAMARNLLADKIDFSQRVSGLKALVEKQTQDLAEAQKKLQELTAQISALDALKEQLAQKELERADLQNLIVQLDLLQAREDARRVRLVQRATTPKEIDFPQLKFMMPGGAVLALLVVAGILFLREFLDQRVKQPSDLAGVGGTRLVGVIPDLEDDPAEPKAAELVVSEMPGSTTAEMFRQLSANVRKAMDAGGLRSLAVVTAHPGGGSTTIASNLAASLHAAGRTVAVVDANLRRPRLASVFGVDADAAGLGDLLSGRSVEPTEAHGIAVFGPGTPESRIYERLSTDEMRRILARLRERYQVVIVDLPPALVAGESMVVADCCDASLLVVRAEKDERGLVGKFVHQLQETHSVLIGTVLMRPSHTIGGYFKKNAELMAEYAKPAGAEAKS
jgi:capsular exopolysaccharide synthesis family protein